VESIELSCSAESLEHGVQDLDSAVYNTFTLVLFWPCSRGIFRQLQHILLLFYWHNSICLHFISSLYDFEENEKGNDDNETIKYQNTHR